MKTRLKKGEDFVSTFSYPTWEQLPELDLYLDQVLLYVNKTCAPVLSSSDKGLTAAMINNYVKHGYIEKPEKKKYQRHQVARLIAITTLKTVFSIQEISSTLNFLQKEANDKNRSPKSTKKTVLLKAVDSGNWKQNQHEESPNRMGNAVCNLFSKR